MKSMTSVWYLNGAIIFRYRDPVFFSAQVLVFHLSAFMLPNCHSCSLGFT